MCGIAGFYGFRNDELIHRISKELYHRGPDGEGFYIDETISLLNRRLAIIDRKGGDQPIYNENKDLVIVYNGEIYNYLELRQELLAKGHIFSTVSDTEVIIHGYEEWGKSCFDRLNGMFAIAIYDKNKQELILVRDHFGIKPLYYSIIGSGPVPFSFPPGFTSRISSQIIFSSEIKPIFESGLIEKKTNDRVIYRYLRFRIHDDGKETFFENIYKLLPGEMMIVKKDSIEIKKYTDLEESLIKKNKAADNCQSDFKSLLIESVQKRLISEVPVGTCLSGGLDSSTIVSIVSKLLNKKVKESRSVGKKQNTFSAVFPGSTNNEETYIDALLRSEQNIASHKVYPDSKIFMMDLRDFVKTQEEPTISTGPYAQYKIMQEAKKYVTVLLDGQGADEMMAGYVPYYFVYFKELLKQKNYSVLLRELFSSLDIIFPYILMRVRTRLGLTYVVNTKKILQDQFQLKYSKEQFSTIDNDLKRRLREDIFSNSLPSLLRYEDKNSMRYSIEGRVPFLDFNLVRYIFSLPNSLIIHNGWNKYVLRQEVKDLLPLSIALRRNKIGFTTPEGEWFHKQQKIFSEILSSESFGKRAYFNQSDVVKAWSEFLNGRFDDTMVFWRMINLELWLQTFFPEAPKQLVNPNKTCDRPNKGKSLEIKTNNGIFYRYPLQTKKIKRGDNITDLIKASLLQCISILESKKKSWFVVVSEKIVAITQGRSYFLWEIKPCFIARVLSRFVSKNAYGIGLGSPWTMQLAIQEVGLLRIIWASLISSATRLFGIRGMFYRIAGREAAAIDGPTEYSVYPSNLSSKLMPKSPQKTAEKIADLVRSSIPEEWKRTFQGVCIIDANDLGQNILGNATAMKNSKIEEIFSDNPLGQRNEQTPIALVIEE